MRDDINGGEAGGGNWAAGTPRRTFDMTSALGLLAWLALVLLCVSPGARAERIKDLAQVGGVLTNALVGYGLVVGLDGSGDRTSQAPSPCKV